MGNFFSNTTRSKSRNGTNSDALENANKELENLRSRLLNLENLDKNNDGIVTKNEIKNWMDKQKDELQELFNNQYKVLMGENNEYMCKIKELEKEIGSLKSINTTLRNEKSIIHTKFKHQVSANSNNVKQKIKLTELSKDRIEEFVEELVSDENVNIGYLPDFVEKQIYRNVFTMLIGLLDNVIDSTNIEFMGHEITFDIHPKEDISDLTFDMTSLNSETSDKKSRRRRKKHRHTNDK